MAKTKNISIRFEPEHLKYAMEKTGIKKEQELVDKFLSDFYFIGNPQKNVFNIPTLDRQINNSKPHSEPIKVNQFDAYKSDIEVADTVDQVNEIMKEVLKDKSLNSAERVKLEQVGKARGLELDF